MIVSTSPSWPVAPSSSRTSLTRLGPAHSTALCSANSSFAFWPTRLAFLGISDFRQLHRAIGVAFLLRVIRPRCRCGLRIYVKGKARDPEMKERIIGLLVFRPRDVLPDQFM